MKPVLFLGSAFLAAVLLHGAIESWRYTPTPTGMSRSAYDRMAYSRRNAPTEDPVYRNYKPRY